MNVVFDIDGTISFDGMTIDDEIREVLMEVMHKNHQVVFASARSYRDCINILGQDFNQNLIIGLNGAAVYHKGENVLSHPLDSMAFTQLRTYCLNGGFLFL